MSSQQEPKPCSTTTCPEKPSSKSQDSTNPVTQSWEPGVLKRLPLLGISALLGVLACLIFNITILLTSNGKPQNSWKIQPSVLLAISSAISTGLLRFALAEGAAITWWNKAINGCTIYDLHRNWSFANSIYDVIKQIRFFNILGLASIASVVVAIDSPLFQRATTVTVRPARVNVPLSVGIAQQLPFGYTGAMQRHISGDVTRMTPSFQKVVLSHNSAEPMYLNDTGCANGNCSTTIRAAGLAVDCSLETLPQDFGSLIYGAENGTGKLVPSNYKGTVVGMGDAQRVMFSTNFTFDPLRRPSSFNFTATYKDQKDCNSRLQVNRCAFHLATLFYPIEIVDGAIEFSSSLEDLGRTPETIAEIYDTNEQEDITTNSTIGGVYLAANDLLQSKAVGMQINHAWTLETSGMLAQDHLTRADELVSCQDTWKDPTPQVVAELQKLMFRTALSVPNNSSQPLPLLQHGEELIQQNQTVDVVKLEDVSVFQVHYGYLAAGAAVMGVCLAVVALTFYEWWKIGRPITMSPVDIAKAFNAPVLKADGLNGDLDRFLPVVGDRHVRYGEVRYREGNLILPNEDVDPHESVQTRLELSYLHWTSAPQQNGRYA
ncbi:hypothetical protein BDV27DRAFT_157399 [Aspergillus caelatus]|uniref:Uncharacterized protein n=1 Tax=Aspergillus caelatus TaxID=61420 RepID=A0A5N7A658_9EURO|nr:uncharacterized protein BDV27DRAFT_157399 [Aspergillus caelatus]KAE8364918.1 hypothetical protein BDV27DRAFT_157399 [Aspergillus caelatus]